MPFRFNSKDLSVAAIQNSSLFVKEGVLLFKEKESKRFNKVENIPERFVRLRGNLLFYFKNKEKNSECLGVIVLERFNVVEENSFSDCGFTIEFEESEEQKYEFGTTTKEDLNEWIDLLKSASYEKLYQTMLKLQQEILEKTGQDPLPDYHPRVGNKTIDVNSQRVHTSSLTESDYDNAFMEICLACANLAPQNEPPPATMVKIFTMEPPSFEWFKYSQTEVCEESHEPNFFKTITLGSKLQLSTRLKFVIFSVTSKSKNDVEAIGSAVCTIKDIKEAKNCQMTLSIMNLDKVVGNIIIQGWLRENGFYDITLKSLRVGHPKTYIANVIQKSFFAPTRNGSGFKFQEFLAESSLCFKIPCMLLKLYISEEKETVLQLHAFGQLHPEWEKLKKDVVQYNYFDLIQRYSNSLADLCQYEGVNFKSSSDKAKKELEFIPTNLHVHSLCVTEDNDKEFFYDFITVGAPTAHYLKYKMGGLKRMIENNDENIRKVLEGCGPNEKRMANYIKAVHSIDNLKKLKDGITRQINILKSIVESDKENQDQFKSCRSLLSAKIGELLGLNSTSFVQESFSYLLKARTYGPELRVKSMTISNNIDDPSSSEIKWEWSGTEFKPVNKLLNSEDQVLEILKKFQSAINSGISSEINTFCKQLDTISSYALSLINKINVTMRFIQMQGEALNSGLVEFRYRRDIVFSQTLTSVVAGFVVMLSQQIHNSQFLDQLLRVGLLVHFESLLTTYGEEMGMIEDMYVGVSDLKEVKFKIVYSDSNSYPIVSGNRSGIVVEFPLKSKHFKLLPRDLQDGCTIKLFPVMFSIGINESATLAEKFGDTSLQEVINSESCISLQNYFHSFMGYYPDYVGSRCSVALPLEKVLNNLINVSNQRKSKNYEVLLLSEELCLRMNGLRLTCCKSAKDRTAMSITLEIVKILEREHNMREDVFNKVLNSVRSQGVRLINSYKNVGLAKYAFNKVQVRALPVVYRPPEGTIGKYLQT
ncbi:inositol polyphosphate-4-phosphatase type I A isoform X1 [Hydra vulgaris]|nr:inositol polyphosphate-4-phosphatase type I A-like [Hydra vulgaris]